MVRAEDEAEVVALAAVGWVDDVGDLVVHALAHGGVEGAEGDCCRQPEDRGGEQGGGVAVAVSVLD